MSIEIDSLWTDGDNIIRVKRIDYIAALKVVIYEEIGVKHILTERDFLEQYKPYEVVYEWQWAYITNSLLRWHISNYMTEEEFKTWQGSANSSLEYQRLDFTKRERTC